jgi:flagellar biosynthesis protein FlhA
VLLVSQGLRAFISRMVRHGIQGLHVLSYEEIPEDRQIRVVASVGNPAVEGQKPGQVGVPRTQT